MPEERREGSHPVRILQRRFQGVSTRYTVEWNGEAFDVVALGTIAALDEGAEARIWIAPERARVIARRDVPVP